MGITTGLCECADSDSEGPKQSPGFCISNNFPGEVCLGMVEDQSVDNSSVQVANCSTNKHGPGAAWGIKSSQREAKTLRKLGYTLQLTHPVTVEKPIHCTSC